MRRFILGVILFFASFNLFANQSTTLDSNSTNKIKISFTSTKPSDIFTLQNPMHIDRMVYITVDGKDTNTKGLLDGAYVYYNKKTYHVDVDNPLFLIITDNLSVSNDGGPRHLTIGTITVINPGQT